MLAVTPQMINPGASLQLSATLDDTRFNNSQGSEPVQSIAAAEYTIDTPPWQSGSSQPLAAADGSFDQAIEGVAATVDTSGLSQGRHTLYVRGRDAVGNWGPPSAVFSTSLRPRRLLSCRLL